MCRHMGHVGLLLVDACRRRQPAQNAWPHPIFTGSVKVSRQIEQVVSMLVMRLNYEDADDLHQGPLRNVPNRILLMFKRKRIRCVVTNP